MGRERWASRSVFLLAAVGSAVGLGNVWRFPYLAGKYGGGAFLLPYLLALFVVGIPLLMMEFALGQKMQQGAIGSFRKVNMRFGGVGVFALISSFIIVCYYGVVMAWSLLYFIASFGVKWAGDANGYFYNTVLELSDGIGTLGGINWPILFALLFVWIAIYFSVWKGPKSVGKVVLWTVPLPILLLVILLIRAVTLEGFMTGWEFYLTPAWSALFDPEVWVAAFSQIFFTLTLAFGVMIAYASYKKKESDVAKNAWLTAFINSGISLFAGFVVFGVLGHMSFSTGTAIADLAAGGPGLTFVVFPEALSLMPMAWLFSALFFLTLLSLGIDSAFSLVEAMNAAILDTTKKWKIQTLSLLVCTLAFAGGIIFTTRAGLYFLDLIDHFVTNYNLILIGLLQTIMIGWFYGADRLRAYINEVSDWTVGKWFEYALKFVVPIILASLLVLQFIKDYTTPYEGYPLWAINIGWTVVVIPFLIFVFLLLKKK